MPLDQLFGKHVARLKFDKLDSISLKKKKIHTYLTKYLTKSFKNQISSLFKLLNRCSFPLFILTNPYLYKKKNNFSSLNSYRNLNLNQFQLLPLPPSSPFPGYKGNERSVFSFNKFPLTESRQIWIIDRISSLVYLKIYNLSIK